MAIKKDAGKTEHTDGDEQKHIYRLTRTAFRIIFGVGALRGEEVLQTMQQHIPTLIQDHSQDEEHHRHSCHDDIIIPRSKASFSHRYRAIGQKNSLFVILGTLYHI